MPSRIFSPASNANFVRPMAVGLAKVRCSNGDLLLVKYGKSETINAIRYDDVFGVCSKDVVAVLSELKC